MTDTSDPNVSTEPLRILFAPEGERSRAMGSEIEAADPQLAVTGVADPTALVDRVDEGVVDCVVGAPSRFDTDWRDVVSDVRDVTRKLPFVVLVTDRERFDVASVLDAGATDVIEVPATDDALALLARRLRTYGVGYRARQTAERSRNASRFQSAFEHAPDAIVIHDSDGTIREANRQACDSLEYDYDELVGMPIEAIETGIDPATLTELWDELEEDDAVVLEGRHRRKDGAEFPVQVSIRKVAQNGDVQVLAIARDLSERKEREQKLRIFHEAIEHAGHSIYVTDTDGTIEYVNPAFEEATGYEASEAIGENPRILRSDEHDDAFFEELWNTILSGERWHNEVVNRRRNGDRYVVDQTIAPIVNESGVPESFVAINQDITERKATEQTLRAQNRRLEKQQSQMQFFNSLLRHDVLNGMTVIRGNTELLLEELEGNEELRPLAESVYSRSGDIVTLVQDIRSVLRHLLEDDKEAVALEPIQLLPLVRERARRVQRTYPTATIRVDVPDHAVVIADELLDDVLDNVLVNAIQHNDGAEPAIEISVTTGDQTATIRVADDGPGVPDDRKEEIFRQGESGPNTSTGGFGLFFVKTMVNRYGGTVWVEDNDPRGAVFVIELPEA